MAGLWIFLEKEISPDLLAAVVEQAPVYQKVFAGLGLKTSSIEEPSAMEAARQWIGAAQKPDWPLTRRN